MYSRICARSSRGGGGTATPLASGGGIGTRERSSGACSHIARRYEMRSAQRDRLRRHLVRAAAEKARRRILPRVMTGGAVSNEGLQRGRQVVGRSGCVDVRAPVAHHAAADRSNRAAPRCRVARRARASTRRVGGAHHRTRRSSRCASGGRVRRLLVRASAYRRRAAGRPRRQIARRRPSAAETRSIAVASDKRTGDPRYVHVAAHRAGRADTRRQIERTAPAWHPRPRSPTRSREVYRLTPDQENVGPQRSAPGLGECAAAASVRVDRSTRQVARRYGVMRSSEVVAACGRSRGYRTARGIRRRLEHSGRRRLRRRHASDRAGARLQRIESRSDFGGTQQRGVVAKVAAIDREDRRVDRGWECSGRQAAVRPATAFLPARRSGASSLARYAAVVGVDRGVGTESILDRGERRLNTAFDRVGCAQPSRQMRCVRSSRLARATALSMALGSSMLRAAGTPWNSLLPRRSCAATRRLALVSSQPGTGKDRRGAMVARQTDDSARMENARRYRPGDSP